MQDPTQRHRGPRWAALTEDELTRHLGADPERGLTDEQVATKQAQHGANELPAGQERTWWGILLEQFNSLLVWILMLACVISYVAGHTVDVYVILVIITINVAIAFTQEMKAENAVASLRSMAVPLAKVVRGGRRMQIGARELVPGDVIILEEGDRIPADARILTAKNLRTIEASLTGESLPIRKTAGILPPDTLMADRTNMLWMGTFVAGGFAQAMVVDTGLRTAIGEIARSMGEIGHVRTHFHRKVDTLAKQMAVIALASASAMFLIGHFLRDEDTQTMLFTSIAMLVSAIPESLPAIVSIVLAIGTMRMAKRNVIIREFSAVETLGSVSTIITDKTGTLTQNTLTVKRFMAGAEGPFTTEGEGWSPHGTIAPHSTGGEAYRMLMAIAGACNNASLAEKDGTYELIGDPTEGALLVLACKSGLYDAQQAAIERLDDLPFDSTLKMRATLVCWDGRHHLFVAGAPEMVLRRSAQHFTTQGLAPFAAQERAAMHERIEAWSGEAMRVIALACVEVPATVTTIDNATIEGLCFVGITGMMDPPRPDVREAVQSCHSAGIRVIMATGDHAKTALSIAKATGIVADDAPGSSVLTEAHLAKLDEAAFDSTIRTHHVFARLSPAMKLRIATRLQQQGELIAMTGDGVNDAPALKKADVGVAMGIMGTDVARDASKMVLADDNFATIVHAIEEGRIIFNNTRKTTYYLLTTNFAEVTTLLTSAVIALPTPLTAIQILWLNLVTDGVSDFSLATEKGHGDELKSKPQKRNTGIITASILPFLIINAVVMATLSLATFQHFLPQGLEKARTMTFVTMAFCQLWNVINMRSLTRSVFSIGLFTNRWIIVGLIFSITVQVVAVETPFFERIFGFAYVTPKEYMVVVLLTSVVLVLGEVYKRIRYGKAAVV